VVYLVAADAAPAIGIVVVGVFSGHSEESLAGVGAHEGGISPSQVYCEVLKGGKPAVNKVVFVFSRHWVEGGEAGPRALNRTEISRAM
jgi:hypothetical protein